MTHMLLKRQRRRRVWRCFLFIIFYKGGGAADDGVVDEALSQCQKEVYLVAERFRVRFRQQHSGLVRSIAVQLVAEKFRQQHSGLEVQLGAQRVAAPVFIFFIFNGRGRWRRQCHRGLVSGAQLATPVWRWCRGRWSHQRGSLRSREVSVFVLLYQ